MHVTLVINPTAGDAAHESRELVAQLSRRGDEVVAVRKSSRRLRAALGEATDLVAVAGGDGTVAAVIRQMHERRIPLLILPFGTANNIARSLGIQKPQLDLDVIRSTWKTQTVDAGEVDGELIVESAGCGAVAHLVRNEEHSDHLPSFDYVIESEEGERKGEAILIEVMATARAGPRLILGEVDPSDGLLDLVIAPVKSRNALRSAMHTGGRRQIDGLTSMRGSWFTVSASTRWHFDDKAKRGGTRTVRAVPAAWTAMVPPQV